MVTPCLLYVIIGGMCIPLPIFGLRGFYCCKNSFRNHFWGKWAVGSVGQSRAGSPRWHLPGGHDPAPRLWDPSAWNVDAHSLGLLTLDFLTGQEIILEIPPRGTSLWHTDNLTGLWCRSLGGVGREVRATSSLIWVREINEKFPTPSKEKQGKVTDACFIAPAWQAWSLCVDKAP